MDAKLFELDTKMEALRGQMASFPNSIVNDYQERLNVSWIFHESAIEGVVLSYSELKAAIDHRIISDVSLIPMYEDVKNTKLACDALKELLDSKKPPEPNLDLVRKLYLMLTPDGGAGAPFRKENPLHRQYYHEIVPPDKIAARMKTFGEWLESTDFTELHPLVRAARLQFQLLQIYPWTKNTGRVARLIGNYILLKAGFLPAVIHSIERQRYYDSLRHENDGLLQLLVESMDNSIDTSIRFFQEIQGLATRRAS
jgi:Fic family protein